MINEELEIEQAFQMIRNILGPEKYILFICLPFVF